MRHTGLLKKQDTSLLTEYLNIKKCLTQSTQKEFVKISRLILTELTVFSFCKSELRKQLFRVFGEKTVIGYHGECKHK